MESVSSTSIYKLFLIATVVGFVCVNIIAVMFDYIDKIRLNNCKIIRRQDVILIQNPKELKQRKREQAMNELKANVKRHMFIIIIDAILLILMVFAIWKYDYSSDEMSNVTNSQQEDVNKKEQNDNIFVPTDEPVISITPIFSDENGDIISEETEISTLE